MTLSRRQLLSDSASLVLGSWLLGAGLTGTARASGLSQGFVLSVHAGSWDGYAGGLLQPETQGAFPSGVFERGARVSAANPFLNEHVRHGAHIFHHYNKVLKEVADQLLHVTCQPGSLDHNVARILQKSGAPNPGTPHWALGAGQMLRASAATSGSAFIVTDSMECMASGAAPQAIGILAMNIAALRTVLGQPQSVGMNPPAGGHEKLIQAMIESFGSQGRASVLQDNIRGTFETAITTAYEGVADFEESSPHVISAKAAINENGIRDLIESTLGKNPETTAILSNANLLKAVAEKFQVAGILASSGASPGMAITMPGEDRHFGGSQVETARISAVMWAGLVTFWNFIKSKNLQNKTLAIVTHEFTRSPWNGRSEEFEITHDNQVKKVLSRGTDHHPANGLYLLSGKFPSGKLGGIADGFAATGGRDFGTGPSLSTAPPTTLAAVGSALMAVFPEVFRHPGQLGSGRVVRGLWPAFSDEFIVQPIRDIS